jgi:two-component system, OmpR family, phosphate regulon sensor histidine kinase PhoR
LHLTSQLVAARKFLAASWQLLFASFCVGLAISAAYLWNRQNQLFRVWQSTQQIEAACDLNAIRTILQGAELASNAADAKVKPFLKGGELILQEQSEPATKPIFAWSMEADGFRRLRCTLDILTSDVKVSNVAAPKQWMLSRRFSNSSISGLDNFDRCVSFGFLLIGQCASLGWLLYRFRQQSLKGTILNWASNIDSPERESDSLGARRAMDQLDPALAQSLQSVEVHFLERFVAVQRSADQMTQVMSTIPFGVLAFDSDLKLLFVNRAGKELLGIGEFTPYSNSLMEIIRHPTVVEVVQQVASDAQPQEVEVEWLSRKTILRLRVLPLSDARGVLLTVIDETRIKQLENARRDFTANVSHELKTPLSAIKAYAETLLMGALEDPDASRRFVERINEQSNRLDNLIQDLLRLTRIQSQPERPPMDALDLDDVLKTCVDEQATIGQSRNITIDASGVVPGCRIHANLESLRTIVGNLLSNAVRYNRDGGWVKVSTVVDQDFVDLQVEDNGIGIPPEDLERIFERFYRVEKARSQDHGGTGLGLSIVKHLAQSMSADIRVQSQLEQGSTFTLRLKRA